MRLGQVFDPRANALNAWRLVLASGVILWHSFPLTGRMPWAPFVQLLGLGCVDGFFAVSVKSREVVLNRPGFDGGSCYWISTSGWSVRFVA